MAEQEKVSEITTARGTVISIPDGAEKTGTTEVGGRAVTTFTTDRGTKIVVPGKEKQ